MPESIESAEAGSFKKRRVGLTDRNDSLYGTAPRTTRIGIIYETVNTGIGQLSTIESMVSSGMQSLPFPVRSSGEIEEAIERVASQPNGSLIVLGGPLTAQHRDLINPRNPSTPARASRS